MISTGDTERITDGHAHNSFTSHSNAVKNGHIKNHHHHTTRGQWQIQNPTGTSWNEAFNYG